MKLYKNLFFILLMMAILNCSSDSDENVMEPPNNDPVENDITYTKDVAPIMSANCTSCHGDPPTNDAPFSLTTYSAVSNRANLIYSQMNNGIMPPTGRLPQSIIDVIEAWIDGGKKE